jgi:hypothetical protein
VGGVKQPHGSMAAVEPFEPVLNDGRDYAAWCNDKYWKELKCLNKTCSCASWFSTNPTWTTLVLNQEAVDYLHELWHD